jgi:hypothetical protein
LRRARLGRPVVWILLSATVLVCMYRVSTTPFYGGHRVISIRQRAQLHSIDAALEWFANESHNYPPSEANDVAGSPYCGAMKLAEAMMGKDMLGYHGHSVFRADGMDANGTMLYSGKADEASLKGRHGPFLRLEYANAFRLADIYGKGKTRAYPENILVLCDTYMHKRPSGKITGMPILYYRANTSGKTHAPNSSNNIYDRRDNAALVALGVPGDPNAVHPLADPRRFYLNIQDTRVSTPTPRNRDWFILIGAGYDGLYGTADDVCNFGWRYRESEAPK